MHANERQDKQSYLNFHRSCLDTLMEFVQQAALDLPDHQYLNAVRFLLVPANCFREKLESLNKFCKPQDRLHGLLKELLAFPAQIFSQAAVRNNIQTYLKRVMQGFYTSRPKLMHAGLQKQFIEREELKNQLCVEFYFRERLTDSQRLEFNNGLRACFLILSMLYYADHYQVSTATYGFRKQSYTWLEPEFADRLEELSWIKHICEKPTNFSYLPGESPGGCCLVYSGHSEVVQLLDDIVKVLSDRSKYPIIPMSEITDHSINGPLSRADFAINMKQALISRLNSFAALISAYLNSGILRFAVISMPKEVPETIPHVLITEPSGWLVQQSPN